MFYPIAGGVHVKLELQRYHNNNCMVYYRFRSSLKLYLYHSFMYLELDLGRSKTLNKAYVYTKSVIEGRNMICLNCWVIRSSS